MTRLKIPALSNSSADVGKAIDAFTGLPVPAGGGGGGGIPWVANDTELNALPAPAAGTHPIYLVVADAALKWWTGTAWAILAAGGAGGPPAIDPEVNLFVTATQPLPADFNYNTLWIPLSSGVPVQMQDWQIFTGKPVGGPANGSLFIQPDAPAPTVTKALWIPTWPNGTPKAVWEWEVIAGSGATPPDRPALAAAQPVSPAATDLWVALNNDGTIKTPANWKVNS